MAMDYNIPCAVKRLLKPLRHNLFWSAKGPPPRPPPNGLATNDPISFAFQTCTTPCFNTGFGPTHGTGFIFIHAACRWTLLDRI